MADLTITNKQIAAAHHAFQVMAAAGREFPFPTRYAMNKIARKVASEFQDYEKTRVALCEQFAEKDGEGQPKRHPNGTYVIPDLPAFEAALAPVLAETATITGIRLLTFAEMGDVKLTDGEMEGVEPFIIEAPE